MSSTGVLGQRNNGGRPRTDVPLELITDLSQRGLSIRAIVNELEEQGITISRMKVSRVLSGRGD